MPAKSLSAAQARDAVRALYDHLETYVRQNRIPWMHEMLGDDYRRGEAHGIMSVIALPELRAAFEVLDGEKVQSEKVTHALDTWLPAFKEPAK